MALPPNFTADATVASTLSQTNIPALSALSEREAEKALGLQRRTLSARRARRQTVPPHVRVGKRVVYPRHLLLAWIDQQALGGAA